MTEVLWEQCGLMVFLKAVVGHQNVSHQHTSHLTRLDPATQEAILHLTCRTEMLYAPLECGGNSISSSRHRSSGGTSCGRDSTMHSGYSVE